MSGQLVGEVLDAAEAGRLNGLSPAAFHALLAIAERCHHITRQGTVHKPRIQAAIHTHNSSRTADRAIRALKDAGRIRIVKRGYKAPNGASAPPIYELLTLPKLSPPKVAKASRQAFAKTGQNPDEAFAKSEEAFAKTEQAFATQGGDLNGSINGSSNGEVPPYAPEPETVSPQSVTRGRGKTLAPATIRLIRLPPRATISTVDSETGRHAPGKMRFPLPNHLKIGSRRGQQFLKPFAAEVPDDRGR